MDALIRPFKHFLGAVEGLMVGTKKNSERKANQNMKGALKEKVPAVPTGGKTFSTVTPEVKCATVNCVCVCPVMGRGNA